MFIFELPGGHCIHPSTPLEDEFEYVPGEHGRSFMLEEWLKGTCLNPAPKMLYLKVSPKYHSNKGSYKIAPSSESRGFLKKKFIFQREQK